MQVIQNISMDFTVHGITPKIYGKQDDSGYMRAVAISLYSGGAAYPLTKNTGFMLRYKTAAGAIGLYDVLPDGSSAFSVDGNTVTVSLVDQIFAMPGNVECELRVIEPETVVYSGDTAVQTSGMVSTWTWIVEVERSNVGDATIPSDYINVLSVYASTAVQAAAEAKESASSIDTSSLMKRADYDPSNVVLAAGGIAPYVEQHIPDEQWVSALMGISVTNISGGNLGVSADNGEISRLGKILTHKRTIKVSLTGIGADNSMYIRLQTGSLSLRSFFLAQASETVIIRGVASYSTRLIVEPYSSGSDYAVVKATITDLPVSGGIASGDELQVVLSVLMFLE